MLPTSIFIYKLPPAMHLKQQLHMCEGDVIPVLLPAAALTQTFPDGRVIRPQEGVSVQLVAKSTGYRGLPLHHHRIVIMLTSTGAADSREICVEASVTLLCLKPQAGGACQTPWHSDRGNTAISRMCLLVEVKHALSDTKAASA